MGWDASYDFDGEMISYRATLARDPDFADVLTMEEDLVVPQLSVEDPGEGQYFLKVEATNASGYTQVAFDTYVRVDNSASGKVYGTLCFYILADGSVVLDGGYVDADSDDAAGTEAASEDGAAAGSNAARAGEDALEAGTADEAEGASPTGATAEPSATKTGEER